MKRVTFYLSEETIQLIDHLYALRIIDGKKTERGKLLAEAIVLLAEKENRGLAVK
jgi:hypothetical protein